MKTIFLFTAALFLSASLLFAENPPKVDGNSVENESLSWDLSDIYTNWEAWQADFDALKGMLDKISSYKGRLSESAGTFIEMLQLEEELSKKASLVYRYPAFMRDLNSRDMDVSGRMQQVMAMFSQFGTVTSWITPEMLTIPKETMEKWIADNEELQPYAFNLMETYRMQEHVLSADKEELLSYFSRPLSASSSIYDELSTSDIQFPTVTLSSGESVQLTHGTYAKLMETLESKSDRKLVFESYYELYKNLENTYAAIYRGICETNSARAKARGYAGTLQMKLEGNNIPMDVYTSLIKTAHDNVEPLQRYLGLKKKIMKLEQMHSYDLNTKLVSFDKEYEFDEAIGVITKAVKPLGDDYVARIKAASEGGWIDVYEKPNKTSGAYSANVYGVHPYILMNWNKSLNHVFTLAHELGHSMHSIYSNENQPYATHSYTIFVAEVASTFNEHMLLQHMIDNAKEPAERIALLQQAIENIWSTFYIQSLYADYEYQVNQLVENGQPVTAEVLSNIMGGLYAHYYGEVVEKDDYSAVKWARVPHFFGMPYYVYQYATSFSASSAIFQNVTQGSKKDRSEALAKYLELLKSGGNDYPVRQLQKAGVDLTSTSPFEAVVVQMGNLVSQLEEELEKM